MHNASPVLTLLEHLHILHLAGAGMTVLSETKLRVSLTFLFRQTKD